jgi:hypothetical protein
MNQDEIEKTESHQRRPKQRLGLPTFSIKSLLILTALVALGIFLFGSTTITITIPHDKGAYIGGVPKTGNIVDVYGGKKEDSLWVVKDVRVAAEPQWSFRDGIAMKLDISMRRYQAWPLRGFDYCRIAKKE